jgi:hypothetical protein
MELALLRKQIDERTGDYFFCHRPAGARKLGLVQRRSGVRRFGVMEFWHVGVMGMKEARAF